MALVAGKRKASTLQVRAAPVQVQHLLVPCACCLNTCSTHNPATCLSMHAEYSRSLMRVACSHLEAQQTVDPRVCGGKCNASSASVCPSVLTDRLIHMQPAPTCAYVFA